MSFSEVQIARVRDYWNNRPCNARHSTAPIRTMECFDPVDARKYFGEYIPSFAAFEHWRSKKVVEIGCGIGTDTISVAYVRLGFGDAAERRMELTSRAR